MKINRIVCIQDGIDRESKKRGEPGIRSLHHERLRRAVRRARHDEQTGRFLNPDMEFYKLAGINDIGEIIVHLDIREETTSVA